MYYSNLKYNIGDKVIVRPDLNVDDTYSMFDSPNVNVATAPMVALAGKTVTIFEISFGQYMVEEYENVYWTDEMFVGLADTKVDLSKDNLMDFL